MKLPFTHLGRVRHLVKHPRVQQALKAGTLTEAEARAEPWYLRAKFPGEKAERYFALQVDGKKAIADALDKLNGQRQHPEQFGQWLAERDARRGLTVGKLAADWAAAGHPFNQVKARTTKQADAIEECLKSALPWWEARTWASINAQTFSDYALWRRQKVQARHGASSIAPPRAEGQGEGSAASYWTGDRSTDLELAALSCLGQWAVLSGRVEKNPFEKRPRFQDPDKIRHCHHYMPENDEQLHTILQRLFTHKTPDWPRGLHNPAVVDLNQRIAGGYLAFSALSGLRPGEAAHLLDVPALAQFPTNLARLLPGQIYPMPDGTQRLKVFRLKNGQNPAVNIHPAMKDFLQVWTTWLHARGRDRESTANIPTVGQSGSRLFPISPDLVSDHLNRACAALGLPKMKPHGIRSYYVRVRRSQGENDNTIALELGQATKGDLIRRVYGDPIDPVGGNLHDWLPKDQPAAWHSLLAELDANIVPVKFG